MSRLIVLSDGSARSGYALGLEGTGAMAFVVDGSIVEEDGWLPT